MLFKVATLVFEGQKRRLRRWSDCAAAKIWWTAATVVIEEKGLINSAAHQRGSAGGGWKVQMPRAAPLQ